MAIIHYYSLNELEEILLHTHVEDEMQYFIDLSNKDEKITQLHTSKFTAYKSKKNTANNAYPFLSKLSPGLHEVDYDNRTYTIAIHEVDGFRYSVLYDETEFENREVFFLLTLSLSIILAIIFSLWFGYWISGKIILPIRSLAKQVSHLQARQPKLSLSGFYADDEVGALADTFDKFIKQLHLFIERERSFTADASHELRTPLAIIQGAVEVMLANENLSESDKLRIERIERAARDMHQTLSALLVLAREPTENAVIQGEINLSEIVTELIHACQPLYLDSMVELNVSLDKTAVITAPENIVNILVGNMIRNAFIYTEEGYIDIQLEENKLTISDSGIGIPESDLPHVFERGYRGTNVREAGSGLGLSLSKRICDHFGWELDIQSQQGKGTDITWNF